MVYGVMMDPIRAAILPSPTAVDLQVQDAKRNVSFCKKAKDNKSQ